MEKFSQRVGIQHVNTGLQMDSMDEGLKKALLNVFVDRVRWGMPSYYAQKSGEQIWKYCFNKLLDEVPSRDVDKLFKAIQGHYFTLKWYEVYDFIEFVANHLDIDDSTKFIEVCNSVLKDHLSAYRFVGKKLVQATNRWLLFLNLVHDLLQNLGFRVITESMEADTGIDFLAYYPITSPDGTTREQVWVVEVKYRNLAGKLGIATLHQIYAYSK